MAREDDIPATQPGSGDEPAGRSARRLVLFDAPKLSVQGTGLTEWRRLTEDFTGPAQLCIDSALAPGESWEVALEGAEPEDPTQAFALLAATLADVSQHRRPCRTLPLARLRIHNDRWDGPTAPGRLTVWLEHEAPTSGTSNT